MKQIRISRFFLVLLLLTMVAPFSPLESEAAGPNPVVIMETSMGRIIVQLYPDKTPITVKNFLQYVDDGFYNGTIFHRVVRQGTVEKPGQGMNVVQGGGFIKSMIAKRPPWGPIPIEDATGLDNSRGTIAMARGGAPNSATSQFFFNVYDNHMLNPAKQGNSMGTYTVTRHGYCAFGKVIRGMDIINKMLKVKTGKRGQHQNVPLKPITLKKAYRAH
jgi:peptidyl-prolyl cis-trans isomerase A (cyclophilin A)/peptidyl-prolyl cis-trans isomerase B (cyclophilin B)